MNHFDKIFILFLISLPFWIYFLYAQRESEAKANPENPKFLPQREFTKFEAEKLETTFFKGKFNILENLDKFSDVDYKFEQIKDENVREKAKLLHELMRAQLGDEENLQKVDEENEVKIVELLKEFMEMEN